MFTSRSEYRVSLRADNADLRLTAKGRAVGVVGSERWAAFESSKSDIEEGIALMERMEMPPDWWVRKGFEVRRDGQKRRCVAGSRALSASISRGLTEAISQRVRPAALQGRRH